MTDDILKTKHLWIFTPNVHNGINTPIPLFWHDSPFIGRESISKETEDFIKYILSDELLCGLNIDDGYIISWNRLDLLDKKQI